VWSRNKDEYDLLVYVANWPENRSVVWDILLKARAIENQAYVAGVNRVGEDGMKIHYTGDSQVLDAKGRCLANFDSGKEGVIKAELSLNELKSFRTVFPVLKDGDAYRLD
jgi:predicted amidohydrolase